MSDTLSAEASLATAASQETPESPRSETPSSEPLAFKKAFMYPFNRAVGLLNILWMLIPIFGWFALMGYAIRIVREFCEGRFEQLPAFAFWSDCGLGFKMFFKMIPFFFCYGVVMALIAWALEAASLPEWLLQIPSMFANLFVIPLLTVNFFKKGTVSSYFEFAILPAVSENLGDYVKALLKDIGLFLVYFPMFLVLVGFPAAAFTKNIFLTDFYRRRVR